MEKSRWLGTFQVLLAGDANPPAKGGKRILKHRLDDPESERNPNFTLFLTGLGDLQLGFWIGSRQLGIIPDRPSLPAVGWQVPLQCKRCASCKRHGCKLSREYILQWTSIDLKKICRKRIHGSKVLPAARIMLPSGAKQKSQLPIGTIFSALLTFSRLIAATVVSFRYIICKYEQQLL